jgi:hypothetical protein
MLQQYVDRALRWLRALQPRGPQPPPDDRDSFVRQPVRRGPPSLAAGVALEEPVPPSNLNLFGALLKRPSRRA